MSYETKYYSFSEHPDSDSCWSLSVGPDGRIYAAACCEITPGGIVKVTRYNETRDRLDYLFDLDRIVDDPRDSGRATQCKIHYSFVPSMHDDILYMASHLSGPPVDLPAYSPWHFWHDAKRCFRGSALLAYDTKRDVPLWWDTLIPKEGCRCLLHDEEYGRLYALSYPRDHFILYDIEKRHRRDLGRIGSINGQVLFSDRKHRIWGASDYGRLFRYDPAKDRLEITPHVLPYNSLYQTGWHSVLYDAVAAPDGEWIYAVTWIADPHLIRFRPDDGEWGHLEDLGPVTQKRDLTIPTDTFLDHCGGLTFAGDGQLYYVASRWRNPLYNPLPNNHEDREGVVWRLDPNTLERREVALLVRPDAYAQYVSRGAVDQNGNLFFGHVGPKPTGIFKLTLPENRRNKDAHLPIRMWG